MLVAQMHASDELVKVASTASTDTDVAMVVAPSRHTGFVTDAQAPCVVMVPEGDNLNIYEAMNTEEFIRFITESSTDTEVAK